MNTLSFSNWWNSQSPSTQGFIQGCATGMTIGTIVPTVINPLEKVNAQIQVSSHHINFWKSLKIQPFKGLHIMIANGLTKSVVLFGTLPLFQQITDTYISHRGTSSFAASVCASFSLAYILSPFQVLKVRLYTQQENTARAVLKAMPKDHVFRILFAGSSTAALKNTLYWPSYLFVSSKTHCLFQDYQVHPGLALALAGGLGGFAACFLSYPLDVITKRQKVNNLSLSMKETAFKIWGENGIKSFFRGMFKAQFTRIFVAGILTEVIYDQSNKLFNSFKTDSHSLGK